MSKFTVLVLFFWLFFFAVVEIPLFLGREQNEEDFVSQSPL